MTSRNIIPVTATPYDFNLEPPACALVIIDMQRDFLEPGGFGEALGNDVSRLQPAIAPIEKLLGTWRARGLTVVHTREGHRPDLSDLPPAKNRRRQGGRGIGDPGPMGRLLVRGEAGHAIVPTLAPREGEIIVDKPGKGAFWATELHADLQDKKIRQLIITGVTTEVCVNTTVREANDRGYDCLVVEDGVASYFPELHAAALAMITAQGGIFGWITKSETILKALE